MDKNRFNTQGSILLIVLFLIVGVIVVGASLYAPVNKNVTSVSGLVQKIGNDMKAAPFPTPFPFAELTVPYLQARTYASMLNERKQYQDRPNYVSYTTSYMSDGLKINGLLTIPKGQKPEGGWPAIVFVHGYIPPTLYKTTEKYVEYVDYLARNGFVVFKIDLRGHGSSEGEPSGGYYSSDYVIDTLHAYAALESFDQVNKNAIGLWGHSMAGNVASRAMAAKKSIPAVVIWAGAGYTYSDLQEYRLNDNSYRPPNESSAPRRKRDELFAAHGQFTNESEFWKQVPATNYLSNITGAIELHHAIDDTVVSVEYSRNLGKILNSANIPHQVYEYPSGGHNITGASFNIAMLRTTNFFKENLK